MTPGGWGPALGSVSPLHRHQAAACTHRGAVSPADQKLPVWRHSASPARLFPAPCFTYQLDVLMLLILPAFDEPLA